MCKRGTAKQCYGRLCLPTGTSDFHVPAGQKTSLPINMEFFTFNYVGEITKCAKMVRIGWQEAVP
jgi:hypothetical protein